MEALATNPSALMMLLLLLLLLLLFPYWKDNFSQYNQVSTRKQRVFSKTSLNSSLLTTYPLLQGYLLIQWEENNAGRLRGESLPWKGMLESPHLF